MSTRTFPKSASFESRVAIGDLIGRMGYLIDRLDWERVAEGLCEHVTTDFVSLLGGEPKVQPKAELLRDYAAFLPGFHALQHMINLVDLELSSDDSARSHSYVRATHRFDDQVWIVGGIYRHDLVNLAGQWRISAIQFTLLFEEGDRSLVEKASQRAREITR